MDLLLNTRIQHRIACHSYSHVRFNFDEFTEVNIKGEIEKFTEATDVYGLNVESLVCPQNIVRFEKDYFRYGYKNVRTAPMHGDKPDSKIRRIFCLPPFSTRNEVDGICRESGSVLYNPGVKRRQMLPLLHFRTKRAIQSSMRPVSYTHLTLPTNREV